METDKPGSQNSVVVESAAVPAAPGVVAAAAALVAPEPASWALSREGRVAVAVTSTKLYVHEFGFLEDKE